MPYVKFVRKLPYNRDHLPPTTLAKATGLSAPPTTDLERRAAAYRAESHAMAQALTYRTKKLKT